MQKMALVFIFSATLFSGWLDNIYRDIFNISCLSKRDMSFDQSWKPFLSESKDAIETFEDLENAENSWNPFIKSKDDIQEDFNEILEDMILAMTDDKKIIFCLKEMKDISKDIFKIKTEILNIKEKNVNSSDEKLQDEVREKFKEISNLENKLNLIQKSILKELNNLGLEISEKELEALLIRVDSNNIIQMMLIFDISKKITLKLEKLMLENRDNIQASKRYYGMNLILSEIAVFIQRKYLHSINNKYIPKLNKMIDQMKKLKKDTELLLKKSKTETEKNIYSANIQSQNLTIKTARLYIGNLIKQRNNIKRGLEKALKNLNLTLNTFKTMEVSSNLLNFINLTQKSFSEIMLIQLPEIVPFENIQIEKEYKKLTKELKQ